MDEDAAWYGSRPRPSPGHIVEDGVPAPAKGRKYCRYHPSRYHARLGSMRTTTTTTSSPLFGLCLLWPRSPVSATTELLFALSWVELSWSPWKCLTNYTICHPYIVLSTIINILGFKFVSLFIFIFVLFTGKMFHYGFYGSHTFGLT